MHPAHADVDGVQHHANRFVHQSSQAKLGRHQVGLVPIRFPDNLQDTYTILRSQALTGQSDPTHSQEPVMPQQTLEFRSGN